MALLHQDQLMTIRQRIQTELQKRGIFAEIIEFYEAKGRIQFYTDDFVTTPTIFKRLWVDNFGSNIKLDEEKDVLEVWVNVHFSYEHFGGGSNGCEIFNLRCVAYSKDNYYGVSGFEIW